MTTPKHSGLFLYRLYTRYFSDHATEKEIRALQNTFISYKEEAANENKSDALKDQIWEKLQNEIRRDTVKVVPLNSKKRKRRVYIWFSAAACILITCSVLWMQQIVQSSETVSKNEPVMAWNTISSPADKITKITMPDGTEVVLNMASTLQYDKNAFNQKNREVWLNGEAFFDVSKNPEKKFIIHTADLKTVVRGTSFNVKAYAELPEISVSVKTGKVEVYSKNKSLAALQPNQQIVYKMQTQKSAVGVCNGEMVNAWQEGYIVFHEASKEELILRIEQRFHVNVEVKTTKLDHVKLNALINKTESAEKVLQKLQLIYNIHYIITDNHITIY